MIALIGTFGRIARVCGTALDARRAERACGDVSERAQVAGWIAGNVLAARGVRIDDEHAGDDAPAVVGVRTGELGGLLAAVAVMPALIDGDSIPARWRIALRALGMPLLDRPTCDALAGGASVAVLGAGSAARTLAIGADDLGYRVRTAPAVGALSPAT